MYTIIERTQTVVGEVNIVTRSYRWTKCELVCMYKQNVTDCMGT